MAETCSFACPVARTAQLIEGKWTTLIVRDLLSGPQRFSELRRSLDGISPKVLTERLRLLERTGLVRKEIYPCQPPKTIYHLTALGQDFHGVIAAMAAFGRQLLDAPPTEPV